MQEACDAELGGVVSRVLSTWSHPAPLWAVVGTGGCIPLLLGIWREQCCCSSRNSSLPITHILGLKLWSQVGHLAMRDEAMLFDSTDPALCGARACIGCFPGWAAFLLYWYLHNVCHLQKSENSFSHSLHKSRKQAGFQLQQI